MMKVQKALIQQALIAHEAQLEREYSDYVIRIVCTDTTCHEKSNGGWVVKCSSTLSVLDGTEYEPSEKYTTSVWFNEDLTIDEII